MNQPTSPPPPTPRELTDAMVSKFRKATAEIFPITRDVEYSRFEKGLYAHLIVKPIKRIARLLTADRELLVLFSTFPDQQPRTIETATNIIDSSDGRLEPSIAIVVHADPSGNQKLREWGRESSLSVIPVFATGGIPTGDELERLLFAEFYAYDAFDVSGPVSDDSRFYGRRGEAQDVARQLQKGQVRACLGIRKTGKTSIIHRIIDVLEASHSSFSIVADCSKDSIWQMSDGQLLSAIADAVLRAKQDKADYISVQAIRSPQDLGAAADRLVAAVRGCGAPVILFFDEVDYITPGSPTQNQWRTRFNPFWRNLRAAFQEVARSGAVLSVFVSGVSSKWFRIEAIDGVENAALAFIPEEYLSPLATEASVSMIRTLARTCGLQFEHDASVFVAESCGNIPYWIRKACSYIHRGIPIDDRPYDVSLQEATALIDLFIESEGAAIAELALSHLFRVYPEIEEATESCYLGKIDSLTPMMLSPLLRYGILVGRGKSSKLSGKMMLEGIRLYLQKRDAAPTKNSSVVAFSSLSEWAEELALCNARRNLIEKRLRGVAVNFIRFDVLQKRSSGTLSDRVTRYLEEPRKSRFKHLSADEVIEKFNWTDLSRLVEKEWGLFAGLFGDKNEFTRHARTLNERYDAHAKDADRLQIAVYRKSLDYFEERMARE